jgi:hypothetical protein
MGRGGPFPEKGLPEKRLKRAPQKNFFFPPSSLLIFNKMIAIMALSIVPCVI